MELMSLWIVGPLILVYSTMLACTRSHYAVDIVLAWWALALVFVSVGNDVPLEKECLVGRAVGYMYMYSWTNYSTCSQM